MHGQTFVFPFNFMGAGRCFLRQFLKGHDVMGQGIGPARDPRDLRRRPHFVARQDQAAKEVRVRKVVDAAVTEGALDALAQEFLRRSGDDVKVHLRGMVHKKGYGSRL